MVSKKNDTSWVASGLRAGKGAMAVDVERSQSGRRGRRRWVGGRVGVRGSDSILDSA
jgi:hypothetical protein